MLILSQTLSQILMQSCGCLWIKSVSLWARGRTNGSNVWTNSFHHRARMNDPLNRSIWHFSGGAVFPTFLPRGITIYTYNNQHATFWHLSRLMQVYWLLLSTEGMPGVTLDLSFRWTTFLWTELCQPYNSSWKLLGEYILRMPCLGLSWSANGKEKVAHRFIEVKINLAIWKWLCQWARWFVVLLKSCKKNFHVF